MSKERLEEMNKKVVGLTDGEDFLDLVQMDVGTYAWFYKQAERVEELEQQNKYFRKIIRDAIDEISFFETRLEEEVNESLRILEKELEESE